MEQQLDDTPPDFSDLMLPELIAYPLERTQRRQYNLSLSIGADVILGQAIELEEWAELMLNQAEMFRVQLEITKRIMMLVVGK